MKETERIVGIYEAYIEVVFQAIGELLSWQPKISPETQAKLKKLKAKRERIIRRYYSGTKSYSS